MLLAELDADPRRPPPSPAVPRLLKTIGRPSTCCLQQTRQPTLPVSGAEHARLVLDPTLEYRSNYSSARCQRSFKPLPARIRGTHFSIRASRVVACFGSEK